MAGTLCMPCGYPGEDEETCLAAPSPRSTARCEMRQGHDAGRPYENPDPVAAALLNGFHCGRTRGGYWKTWPAS
jgi:hypothetical protein